MEYIKEFSQLIIPKISRDLYSNSINEFLKEFDKDEEDVDKSLNLRFLTEKEKNHKHHERKKRIKRIISNNSSEEFKIEEYLTPSSFNDSNSENIELRETTNCSNCSEQNINEFSIQKVKNEQVDIENNSINKTVNYN